MTEDYVAGHYGGFSYADGDVDSGQGYVSDGGWIDAAHEGAEVEQRMGASLMTAQRMSVIIKFEGLELRFTLRAP